MSEAIWGGRLFRMPPSGDIPIGLSSFLRPTQENFNQFVMALDKLLSDTIDPKFFRGKIHLETESLRDDGKIETQRKATLTLLEDWLLAEISWENDEEFRKVVIAPLREVRNLRQKPAHAFTTDYFSTEYYDRRKKLLWKVSNGLSNIRTTFGKHPKANGIKVPDWLDTDTIDVF